MSLCGKITDNHPGKALSAVFGDSHEQAEGFCRRIGGKALKTLCQENNNLLVFPRVISTAGGDDDELGGSAIFHVAIHEGEQRIETGNVMGFIGCEGVSLSISSRFYTQGDDFLLHYLLQKVAGFHVVDLPSPENSNNPAGDFLPYLFPSYFMAAWRQGVYRVGQRFERNDDRLKGNIDVARHIQLNMPFCGKIAYTFNEKSAVNSMTCLIRLTVDVLEKDRRFMGMFHGTDRNFCEAISGLKTLVSEESIRNAAQVVRENLKPLAHPFYSAYKPLQRLCLAILRHRRISFSDSEDTIHGILFDGAWLWEEYLAKIMPRGIKHAENKMKRGGYEPAGQAWGRWYPDFYRAGEMVLDAKYKDLDKDGDTDSRRSDRHQIVAYMHTLHANHGGFVYPGKANTGATFISQTAEVSLNGYGGSVRNFRFEIPRLGQGQYRVFCQAMEKEENRFCNQLATWLGK